jgi:hypothetical protein
MAPMAVLWDSPSPKIKKVAMTLKQLSICYRATTDTSMNPDSVRKFGFKELIKEETR